MQISKHNLIQLDFEETEHYQEENHMVTIYNKGELEIVFNDNKCVSIEFNNYPIIGVRSVNGLEKLMKLIYDE